MAYQYDDRPRFNGMRSGNYRSGSYRNSGGYGRGQRQQRKRSGAKMGTHKRGDATVPHISGWKATRQGLITLVASPAVNYETRSKTQEKWVGKYRAGYGKPELVNCFYNTITRKLTIPELGIVVNPNAPNGGYMGSFKRRNNR